MIAVGDRRGVNARVHLSALLGDAPPLLFGFIGGDSVHRQEEKTVSALLSPDHFFLFQRAAQILRVGLDGVSLYRLAPGNHLDGDGFGSLHSLRPEREVDAREQRRRAEQDRETEERFPFLLHVKRTFLPYTIP